jgi:hypothetical protein
VLNWAKYIEVGVEWGMVIMGYVQVRLKYPDVSQPALKTDSDESVKNSPQPVSFQYWECTEQNHFCKERAHKWTRTYFFYYWDDIS